MSFFRSLHEESRDHARDELCLKLRSLGVEAELAERGSFEEHATGTVESLGVIRIARGPIGWVNIKKDSDHNIYSRMYAVPDFRLVPGFPKARIWTVKKMIGDIINVRWEGNDFGSGLVSRLNDDVSLCGALRDYHGLVVEMDRAKQIWKIREDVWVKTKPMEGRLWNCYEAIARHLLETPIPQAEPK